MPDPVHLRARSVQSTGQQQQDTPGLHEKLAESCRTPDYNETDLGKLKQTQKQPFIDLDVDLAKSSIFESRDLAKARAMIQSGIELTSSSDLYRAVEACRLLEEGESHAIVELLVSRGAKIKECLGVLESAVACCDMWDDIKYPIELNLRHVEMLLNGGAGNAEALCNAIAHASKCRSEPLLRLLLKYDTDGAGIQLISEALSGPLDLNGHSIITMDDFNYIRDYVTPSHRQEMIEHALLGTFKYNNHGIALRLIALGAKGYRIGPKDFESLRSTTLITTELLEKINRPPTRLLLPPNQGNDLALLRPGDPILPMVFETAVCRGNLDIVKFLVEKLKFDVNHDRGMPVIVSCQQGQTEILEYLIRTGADLHARDDLPLIEAVANLHTGILDALLQNGVNSTVRNNQAVTLCARRAVRSNLSLWNQMAGPSESSQDRRIGLECAKSLVDNGADPGVFGISSYLKGSPPANYLHFMSEVKNPASKLYIQNVEPRLNKDFINFAHPSHITRSSAYRYISNCAAVAAILNSSVSEPQIFLGLIRTGTRKVFDEGRGTFKELAGYTSRELHGFPDLEDVTAAFAQQVLLPMACCVAKEDLRAKIWDTNRNMITQLVRDHLVPLASEILFINRPLLDVLRLKKIWHRPDKQLPLSARPLLADSKWYPLFERVNLSGGYAILPLTSQSSLMDEGQALHHCVGGGSYGSECLAGQAHILSLRYEGKPAATIMLVPSNSTPHELGASGRNGFMIQAFKGIANQAPTASEKQAVAEFKDLVRQGRVRFNNDIGETSESWNLRIREKISILESMAGIRYGMFPNEVINHYSKEVYILDSSKTKIPLLRAENIEGYKTKLHPFVTAIKNLSYPD